MRRVKKAGFRAIVVTVDAPVAGKRERDERTKLDLDAVSRLLQPLSSRPHPYFFPFSQADDPNIKKAVSATAPDAPDRPQQPPSAPVQGIAQTLGR